MLGLKLIYVGKRGPRYLSYSSCLLVWIVKFCEVCNFLLCVQWWWLSLLEAKFLYEFFVDKNNFKGQRWWNVIAHYISMGPTLNIHLFTFSLSSSPINFDLNTLRPRQDGRHFPDDIFICIFLNENEWHSIEISLKFVPKVPINNIPALVQIMAWRRPGDKPLSEPMMVVLPTHICVTRPQWFYIAMLYVRADSRFAPNQWETSLQSNDVSHWLGENLESALYVINHVLVSWCPCNCDLSCLTTVIDRLIVSQLVIKLQVSLFEIEPACMMEPIFQLTMAYISWPLEKKVRTCQICGSLAY